MVFNLNAGTTEKRPIIMIRALSSGKTTTRDHRL